MDNPDPTQFIAITDHVSALRLQQAEFDAAVAALAAQLAAKDEAHAAAIAQIHASHELALDEARGIPRPTGAVTKLTIMRRLGPKWATLKAILASLPDDVQDAWTLAQEIRADDPLFAANAAFLQAELELTEEEFTALLTP